MRIARVIFVCLVATIAVPAVPALAKNSTAERTDDRSNSSSCRAYQQAADGSWTELPCQEAGSSGGQTQHKPPAKSGEDEPR
jgi:hypothetical protein